MMLIHGLKSANGGLEPVPIHIIRGSFSGVTLAATTSAPTSTSVWTSTAGCIQFDAVVLAALDAGATSLAIVTQCVVIAWSPVANDHTGVAALLDAKLAQLNSPSTPPVEIANTAVLHLINQKFVVPSDGINFWKTIGVRARGTTKQVEIGLTT